MSPETRGYGTIMVATLGALGAISAGLAGTWLPWRTAFIVAGVAGLGMLFLRIKSMESPLYQQQKMVSRGSFKLLLSNRTRVMKYLACILMGVPIWYSVGLLITMSPELAEMHGISGLKMAYCFILFQVGIAVGDLSSGLLSQWFKTRKKIIMAFMLLAVLATMFHFYLMQTHQLFYVSCFLIGLGCGYLSVFVTATSEHFGTNLRVTVTATVTNFMRGAVTLLIPLHQWIEGQFGLQLTGGLIATGILVWVMAFVSTMWLPETYGKSMDFVEA
jgi:putative MFS transporter